MRELYAADERIKDYLAKTFSDILQDDQFHSALLWHLDYGPAALGRSATALKRIKQIANIASANY